MKRLKNEKKVIRNFASLIPKIRKISEKRGHFVGQHVDVHKGEGVGLMWTHVDRGSKTRFSCGRHKWMAPNDKKCDVNFAHHSLIIRYLTCLLHSLIHP